MHHANQNALRIPLPRALPKDARRKVETAIEHHLAAVQALTAFLDEADGDSDLEPSLVDTGGDDREYDPADPPAREGIDDDEKDVSYNEGHGRGGSASTESEDQECSLGWPERVNQAAALSAIKGTFSFGGEEWGCHSMDGEGEPSLGSQEPQPSTSQVHWAHGDRRDMEADYLGFLNGQIRSFTADMEPNLEAD